MKKLLFLLGMPSSGYEELLRILQKRASEIAANGWIHVTEEYSWSKAWPRILSAARLIEVLAEIERGRRPAADADIFTSCIEASRDGANILISGWAPDIHGIRKFMSLKAGNPALAGFSAEAALLLSRQDIALESLYRQMAILGNPDPVKGALKCAEYYRFDKLDQIYADFQAVLPGNCQYWLHEGSAALNAAHREGLAEMLGLRGNITESQNLPPQSGPGFEIALALANLPRHTQYWPEDYFPAINDLESRYNLRPCLAMPDQAPEKLLAHSEAGNERLAKALGRQTLFAKTPDELCEQKLTSELAGEFIGLLTDTQASGLRRYFHSLGSSLSSGQATLAAALTPGIESISSVAAVASVSVLTLSHNQEKYIGQTIESVLAQQTNFPVEHLIVDDASTDDTRSIIDAYADKYPSIKPIYLRERACKGENVVTLFNACKSKYAALCDGDDYFTDNLKLQKQYDFLEARKECALCFHPVDVVYEDGSPSRVYPPPECLPGGERHIYTIKNLLFANMIQTNSVMYRWRFADGLPEWFDPTLIPADWYWHLLHAETGLIGYLRERMSVYRRHGQSMYASVENGPTAHRAVWGLDELRTYSALDRHFHGKYHDDLRKLANGVFADFVRVYAESGDDALLQKGCALAPNFGREFLAELKVL